MQERDFQFVVPERSQGEIALSEAVGPDVDAILRSMLKGYMKQSELSPDAVAKSLGVPSPEFNGWLDGAPGKIDWLSAAIAVLGLRDIDSLLSAHDGYDRKSHTTITLKEVLLSKVAQISSDEQLRLAIELHLLFTEVPEAVEFLRTGIRNAYDYADHQGIDVSTEQQRIERSLSRIWSPTAVTD